MRLRIEDYIKTSIDYRTQDYNVLGLKKTRTFENGELKKVEYKNIDGDVVVREDIVYNRDDNDYITERVKTITWIRVDGTDHPDIKETHKDYDPREATKAGERKRGNQITDMKIKIIGLIQQTEQCSVHEAENLGITMLLEVDNDISKYVLGAKQPLIDAINNDTSNSWLDNDIGGMTIREYLVTELAK